MSNCFSVLAMISVDVITAMTTKIVSSMSAIGSIPNEIAMPSRGQSTDERNNERAIIPMPGRGGIATANTTVEKAIENNFAAFTSTPYMLAMASVFKARYMQKEFLHKIVPKGIVNEYTLEEIPILFEAFIDSGIVEMLEVVVNAVIIADAAFLNM